VTGTSDKTHFAGLSTAIDYQLDIGWAEKIRPYSLSLAHYLRTLVMDEIEGAYMTIPEGPEMSGFLTSFGIEGIQLHKIRELMWNDYKIQIATTGAAGQSIFRISTHFYDNFEDIDRFIDAVKEVIATRDELRIDPSKPRRRRF
jgi:selenocysteine lyase/cysteine desulfurase